MNPEGSLSLWARILTVVTMNSNIFWVVTPHSMVHPASEDFYCTTCIHNTEDCTLCSLSRSQELTHDPYPSQINPFHTLLFLFHSTPSYSFKIYLTLFWHICLVLPIILPVALYGCDTWSMPLREEHRLRAYDNWVLRRTCEPKRGEIIGGWRKVNNELLHNLYSLQCIFEMIKSRMMR